MSGVLKTDQASRMLIACNENVYTPFRLGNHLYFFYCDIINDHATARMGAATSSSLGGYGIGLLVSGFAISYWHSERMDCGIVAGSVIWDPVRRTGSGSEYRGLRYFDVIQANQS